MLGSRAISISIASQVSRTWTCRLIHFTGTE
jgi:hypothetical protein